MPESQPELCPGASPSVLPGISSPTVRQGIHCNPTRAKPNNDVIEGSIVVLVSMLTASDSDHQTKPPFGGPQRTHTMRTRAIYGRDL